jgi:ribosome-binding factor A
MTQRTQRVDELLRQEIGALLAKEVADPRIGFATITDVETSPDLRHAKVWVSVIGDEAARRETIRALQQAMGFIRHELGKRLRIRRIPDLHVHLDDSAERGTRVLYLLNELEAGVEPDAIQPLHDSLPTPVKRLPHDGDTPDETAAEPPARPGDVPPSPGPRGRGRGPAGGEPSRGRPSRGGPRGDGLRGDGPRRDGPRAEGGTRRAPGIRGGRGSRPGR